jgi:tetratricopeptide (TPR) repeat protein
MSSRPGTPETTGLEEYQRLLTLLDERRFDEAQVRGRILLETGDIGLFVRAKLHTLICWILIEGIKHPSPEAVFHGEEAVRIADRLGERSLQMTAICYLASSHYQIGYYETARSLYLEMLAMLTANPDTLPYGQIIAREGLAQLALVQGRYTEALAYLEVARDFCTESDSHFLLAELYRRQALILLKLDKAQEAAALLQRIDESAFATGPRSLWWKTNLSYTRARLELACDHWATARQLATNALALARELADLPVMAECACLLAILDQIEGRKEAPKRARTALTYAIHSGRRDVVDDVRDRLKEFLGGE